MTTSPASTTPTSPPIASSTPPATPASSTPPATPASRPERPDGNAPGSDRRPLLSAFFTIVLVFAGASGVALLALPGSSGAYFSWDLGAAPVAALIGGLYLGCLPVFAWARTRPARDTVALTVGVLGLAVPTLVATATHHDVFAWDRWQAVGWVVLFCSAPLTVAVELRDRASLGRDGLPAAATGARLLAGALAVAATGTAIAIWVDPVAVAGAGPLALRGLAGRYVGSWCAFVAVTAAVAAVRGRRVDVHVLALAATGLCGGALVGALRTASALGPGGAGWIGALVVATLSAGIAVRRTGRS